MHIFFTLFNYSIQITINQEVIELNKLTLTKTGQVYIPSCIRNEINLEPGDIINIFLEDKEIVMTNREEYIIENQCVFSQNGTVHIPIEIRRLCNIDSEAIFRFTLNKEEQKISLIYDSKGYC
ncbi:AbrB/MazE/SpoVT family DNA-binding domain-containing protein [Metabacillus bambusae]|uniref:AbrB/MazE/SpoVT family DNA-binding domain-containing protein n=1 Tax=Metabacillus bambusae TaxID=2795218 RepID=A0ABS3MZH6_9BACI|nr:AbrB/MazE/SpoVT family DNA-binding domain-containing protein [Metabacillus bambusae]